MADTKQITRYERVKQILDQAAAGGAKDYDGKGLFWQMPLPELLEVKIYGVRMIAPPQAAPVASCCHGGTADSAESRSAISGLIRGLRAQTPFDGTQYPPLPWGGKTVPPDQIGFIADWIDDGCPPAISYFDRRSRNDHEDSRKGRAGNVEVEARSFEVYEVTQRIYLQYGELKQRMNIDCMGEPEIDKLRAAFRQLYHLNKWPEDRRSYNNMALVHQNHCQHGWERFLPWHRIYLYEFEQVLQDVAPGVTMPYWDFTMPQYCPEHPEKGNIIPPSFQCYLTNASLEFLERAEPKLPAAAAKELRKGMIERACATRAHNFFAAVAERR